MVFARYMCIVAIMSPYVFCSPASATTPVSLADATKGTPAVEHSRAPGRRPLLHLIMRRPGPLLLLIALLLPLLLRSQLIWSQRIPANAATAAAIYQVPG